MVDKILTFECTECDIEFKASLKSNGFLPDCPSCGIDYRVFEIKEDE
ncbi:hypothetical protein P8825_15300 [Shouchella clausii]|nr:hypothetical protein [Shouchella clausii]MEB5480931.1 hypothetical protein [Shouchella clausii]